MKAIRKNAKLAGVFLTFLMLSITIPYQSVLAAMVGTEATLDSLGAQQARDDINTLLCREDVQSAFTAQGIDPVEVKARIDSLSDAEVIRIADEIDKLPAGGSIFPTWPFVLVTVLVVIVIIGIVYGIYYMSQSD